MAKRLHAGNYFTPQRDYYCLSCHIGKAESLNWHCHEYYEIELITGGTAEDEISGVPYILNSGDFIFLQPDDVHCIRAVDDKGADLINLAVSVRLLQELLSFLELEEEQALSFPLTGQLPQEILLQFADQAGELFAPLKQIPRERAIVKEWMTICLLRCRAFQKTEDGERLPLWMQQLLRKMKTPEGFTGGLAYLKAHTEQSYPHICRCFQKYLHKTPVEWINEQRLVYSGYLLTHTEQSILEIALECGFHNLSHFNHLFKAYYGVSPTAYRMMRVKEYPMI